MGCEAQDFDSPRSRRPQQRVSVVLLNFRILRRTMELIYPLNPAAGMVIKRMDVQIGPEPARSWHLGVPMFGER